MVNVTADMFADGQAVAEKALNGDSMPAPALSPKSLAAGSATSLYAALDPELECKYHPLTTLYQDTTPILLD